MIDRRFFKKYGEAVKFNRNIIIAGLASFVASSYAAQAFYEVTDEVGNSAVALATDYGVYVPVLALLFYYDNRNKYIDPVTGKRNSKEIGAYIKKLFASFSVSEIIFAVTRFALHYQFLHAGAEAYAASMASSMVAWAVFFIAINLMAKAVKLFRR